MNEDVKAAEKRGYARGYKAGRGKASALRAARQREAEREAFRRRVFLTALPFCLAADGWQINGKTVQGMKDRTRLAWIAADEAMKGLK